MMLLRNTLKVALGLCLAATTVSAQQALQTIDLNRSSVKKNESIKAMKQLNVQEIAKTLSTRKAQVFKNRTSIPYMEAKNTVAPSMTRAGEAFSASYSMSPGIYTLVPGLPTGETEGEYTGHGILAPIDCDVTYTNTSTGAANIEWIFGDEYVPNEEQIITRYYPFMNEDEFEKMPILTAYSVTGIEQKYQFGNYTDPETGEVVQGVVNDQATAFVWNLDPEAETLTNTFYAAFSEGWSQVAFGSDSEFAASYIEFYEKPLSPILLSSTLFYVIAPASANLTTKDFTVNWMKVVEVDGTPMWAPLVEAVTTKPVMVQRFDDFSIWQVAVNTPEMVLINEQFSIIIDGPQDGTGWALLHQVDRTSDKNTCGYIPSKGEYAGRVMTYSVSYDGTNYQNYNTSLDIYLGVVVPFTIMSDETMMWGDSLGVSNEGLDVDIDIVSWTSLFFLEHGLEVTSTADWLVPTITKVATNEDLMYKANVKAEPLPEGVAGRMASIIFTDSRGFSKSRTFIQGDYAAGIDENISQGTISAVVEGDNLNLTYTVGYTQVEVYTASGSLVAADALTENGKQSLAVGNLPKGIYLVKFIGEQTQTIKVVK